MDKKGWRSGGGKRCSDLACDMARLTDSAHDDATPTLEQGLAGSSKIVTQAGCECSNPRGFEF
jgi:hypothetical protein